MHRGLSWFIGSRYVAVRQQNTMVSFISRVSMMGLALGVALLIVVLSVMNGFDKEMRERILGLVPQASIVGYSPVYQWQGIIDIALGTPGVTAAAPYIHLQGLLMRGAKTEATLVQGINPEMEVSSSVIQRFVEGDALLGLQQRQMILGFELAKKLKVAVSDDVVLVLPQTGFNQRLTTRLERFRVVGLLKSGTELDRRIALISIDTAAELARFPEGAVQGVRLVVNDLFNALGIAYRVQVKLPLEYHITDWTRSHGNLYSAIQLSKQLVGLLMLIIIAVAAFNVVSTLFLVVKDKQGDVAILRTLGLPPLAVMSVFMVQGTLIGVIGTAVGVVLGLVLAFNIGAVVEQLEQWLSLQFLSADVYPVDYLPTDVHLSDVLIVAVFAISMSFLATLYPAWRATRIQPADALRYE